MGSLQSSPGNDLKVGEAKVSKQIGWQLVPFEHLDSAVD